MALALGKENAIADWRALIGPTHVYKAAWEKPESLRARYGISGAWELPTCPLGRMSHPS